jgi:NAD(P)-dependent dehydrogenase (short-subunit alcohol dehydrogenase family)
MAGRLAGQSALVSGAGRGFGRSIALRLAADGAAVTLVSRSAGELETVADEIRAAGGSATIALADVSEPDQVMAACDVARATHGAPSILVSNAGVPWPFGPVWDTDVEKWWKAESIHIRAPYLLMHNLMPDMIAAKRGRVICISAIATRLTLPYLSAYSVGKAALNKLVEMAAEEARPHNVQVFAVEPGFVITQLAEDTYNDPDARKWMPHMLSYLDEGRGRENGEADLQRTAERCAVLAAGDYDILSGRYMELPDPIDDWKKAAEYAAEMEPN